MSTTSSSVRENVRSLSTRRAFVPKRERTDHASIDQFLFQICLLFLNLLSLGTFTLRGRRKGRAERTGREGREEELREQVYTQTRGAEHRMSKPTTKRIYERGSRADRKNGG